jgi:formate dehydrogenase subunit delta
LIGRRRSDGVTAQGAGDEKLSRMANQIAAFFRAYSAEEARAGIVQHIADFWTPAMRRTLQDTVDRGGQGLDLLVVQAFEGRSDMISSSSACRAENDVLSTERATRATIAAAMAPTKA